MKKIFIFMIIFIFGNIFSMNIFANENDTICYGDCSNNIINTNSNDFKPMEVNQKNPSVDQKCTGEKCLNSANYMFPTSEFVPGGAFKKTDSTQKRLDNGFITIIQRLMTAFGVLATIIMTIGAGYMVLYNGNDEMLSKGKKIFKMGIISISIALSSYLIVELLKNLLYA